MNEEYILYQCRQCGFIFIIPIDGLRKAKVLCRFIGCNLGHRGVEELNRYDNLIECMEGYRVYKKTGGVVKQIK